MKSKIIGGILGLLILSGCLADEYYNDPISSSTTLSPAVLVPLIYADVNIENLLTKSTNQVKFLPNGEIIVFQRQDSIKKFGINDLYVIPQQQMITPINFALITGTPYSINNFIPISPANAILNEVIANVNFKIKSLGFPYSMQLKITLKDVSIPLQKPVVIFRDIPIGSNTEIIDLLDASILLTDKTIPIEITLTKKNTNNSSVASGSLEITTTINNLTYAKGSIKETTLAIPEGAYDINMGVFRENGGTIVFNNPIMNITYTNSTPFPVNLTPNLVGKNIYSNDTVQLKPIPASFDINKRISASTPFIDTTTYDKLNSNILDFIKITPNILMYKGKVILNPSIQVNEIVEMKSSDGIFLGYNLELPLKLTVNGLNATDTIKFGKSDAVNKITKARLNISSQNGFPFETKSILSFCDSNFVVLDTLSLQMIKAAPVNAQGYVLTDLIKPYYELRELKGLKLENFKKTSKFILKTYLYTSEYKKNQVVIIERKNRIKMQIGLGAELNTSL